VSMRHCRIGAARPPPSREGQSVSLPGGLPSWRSSIAHTGPIALVPCRGPAQLLACRWQIRDSSTGAGICGIERGVAYTSAYIPLDEEPACSVSR